MIYLKAMKFKLSKYIIPTTIAMVLVSIYTNIDGLFIGNVMGDDGLAAINIAWPIVACITAVGTGIGIGGAVLVSSRRGEAHTEKAENAKYTAFLLLCGAGVLCTFVFLLVFRPLLKLLGAEGAVLQYASSYALVVSLGAVFQILGAGLAVLLRNDGKTVHSMLYTFIGLLVHIALDILLVKRFKLYGIGISTVLSQLVIMLLCLCSLSLHRSRPYRPKTILLASAAPFGLNFVPSLTLLVTNYFALKIGGTPAVSAYAVMSYVVFTYEYIFQGICDGVQPILSFTGASEHTAERKRAVKAGVTTLFILSLVMTAATPLVSKFLPAVFSVSQAAEDMIRTGLAVYAVSYVFRALVKWICAYAYAVNDIFVSNLLTYAEPLFFSPICLSLLPRFFGTNGLWLSQAVSPALTCLLGGILLLALGPRSKRPVKSPADKTK